MVAMKPGEDSWRPADDPDEEDAGENWRVATEDDEDEEERDYEEDLPPHWRDSVRQLLLAPGGRYRLEGIPPDPDEFVVVCDGESSWRICGDETVREHGLGLKSGAAELLDPRWLISRFDLELTGAAEAAGRPAYRVTALPRPATAGLRAAGHDRIDRVDVLVDAGLGILLRREAFADGKQLEVSEVRALTVDPADASDPARFRPPVRAHQRRSGQPAAPDGTAPAAVRRRGAEVVRRRAAAPLRG
jgi:hypothetical protein